MRGTRTFVILAVSLALLAPATAPAIAASPLSPASESAGEPAPSARPRLMGQPGAPRVNVVVAVAVGNDLAYLGARGKEFVSLRWVDGASGRERRLAVTRSGDFSHQLGSLRDGVVFTGTSQRYGVEPWRSDGTIKGTSLLRDVARGRTSNFCAPGPGGGRCGTHAAGSDPGPMVEVGSTGYFQAYDPKHGSELWRTDGTRAGTRLLKDIRPGKGNGIDAAFGTAAMMGGDLYFAADDGRHGYELWRSDGTRAGTRMIRDIGPRWSVAPSEVPVVAGDLIYFTARTPDAGFELWRTDGTSKGTLLVLDIVSGPRSSRPASLVAIGEQLFFTADDREHGRELWRTDGTREGTTMLRDIRRGEEGSMLDAFTVLDGWLYFIRRDVLGGDRPSGYLYRTDGTEAGTQPFGPKLGGTIGLVRSWGEFPAMASSGGRLFFPAADDGHGLELWSTDGTFEGTRLVADLREGPGGSRPEWLVAAEGGLYFTANDGQRGRQWWQLPTSEFD